MLIGLLIIIPDRLVRIPVVIQGLPVSVAVDATAVEALVQPVHLEREDVLPLDLVVMAGRVHDVDARLPLELLVVQHAQADRAQNQIEHEEEEQEGGQAQGQAHLFTCGIIE